MHVFENVTGVLFCVGISEYDKFLYEDNRTNRIHEARKLFHEICQSKWFTETAMILFLNKDDIFREKIAAGKYTKTVCCFLSEKVIGKRIFFRSQYQSMFWRLRRPSWIRTFDKIPRKKIRWCNWCNYRQAPRNLHARHVRNGHNKRQSRIWSCKEIHNSENI